MNTISLRATPEQLIDRANDVSVFDVLRDWFEINHPREGRSFKDRCPFGWEHPDGGADKGWRTYPVTNSTYCVDEETEILTERGWRDFRSVEEGESAWVVDPETGLSRWSPILEVLRFPAQSRRMLSLEMPTHSSLTTEDHRWLVRHVGSRSSRTVERLRFITSAQGFSSYDRILYPPPSAEEPVSGPPKYTDAFVELLAWFWTEGSWVRSGGWPRIAVISQSHAVNPALVDRIRAVLTRLFGPARSGRTRGSEGAWRESVAGRMTRFTLSVGASAPLRSAAPGRVVDPGIISAMTTAQLRLFVETSLDADGARVGTWRQLCQSDSGRLDAFQMACTLLGQPTNIWRRASGDWACQLLNRSGPAPYRRPQQGGPWGQWVTHDGPVWCVRTLYGTWVARRRGTVYVTGNCFVMHGYMGSVRLVSLKEAKRPLVAARAILVRYDLLKSRDWRERLREMQVERETADTVTPTNVVAALHEGLSAHPGYEQAQHTPEFRALLESELEGLDVLLSEGLTAEPQVRAWYHGAKARLMGRLG